MMHAGDETNLRAAVAPFGRVNYEVRCTVDDVPAIIVMNESGLAVATTYADSMRTARFLDVRAEGPDAGSRQVRLVLPGADAPLAVEFFERRDLERFVRVLGVRQQAVRVSEGGIEVPVRIVSSYSSGRPVGNEYEKWAEFTMTASTVLMIVGWASLVLGVVAAFIVLVSGSGVAAMLVLVAAVSGCAMPLCLAALARTVVLRFRQQDAAG